MSVKRGNYYLKKAIDFLNGEGFQVEKLEKLNSFFNPRTKKVGWKKSDIWFSDLVAMNEERLVFGQVKGGHGDLKINKAIENYKELKTPPGVEKWVIVYRPRVKHPEIIEV